jgi:hypothetical protein
VRTFCSATNNTATTPATTTHQRRNRDAQKDKEPQRPGRAPPPSPPPSMKTTIQFVDSHSFIHPSHTYISSNSTRLSIFWIQVNGTSR